MPAKILFICHRSDTRFTYGGHTFRRAIQAMLQKTRPDLAQDTIYFEDQSRWRSSPLAKGLTFLRSLVSPLPAKACHFKSRPFATRLTDMLGASHYDAVIITGIDMLWCLDLLPKTCCRIYLANNVEHLLYAEQTASLRRLPVLGRLFTRDLEKLKRYEHTGMTKIDRIIAISTTDEAYFHTRHTGLQIATILPTFANQPARDRGIVGDQHGTTIRLAFLGNLEWWPNRSGINWFLHEIWPHVANTSLEVHLYGKASEVLGKPSAKIYGHGYADNLDSIWANSDIMIQPITEGGGVNIKVAEAIYNRLPTLATPLAMRGLPVRHDPAITVLNNKEEWISFLNSGRPDELRTHSVRPENSRLFDLAGNADKLATFLAPCLPPLPAEPKS